MAYFSRKLKLETKEAEWTVSEAELHGMYEAILHFRAYLQNGLEFEVIVDHEALTFLKMASQTQNNKKLLRMMIELQGFNFRITYKKGAEHLDADGVSRMLRFQDRKEEEEKDPESWYGGINENDIEDIQNYIDLLKNSGNRIKKANEETDARKLEFGRCVVVF